MLKKPIQAGRVYKDRAGLYTKIVDVSSTGKWLADNGMEYDDYGMATDIHEDADIHIAARVKPPKADKPKKPKWRDAWIVAGQIYEGKESAMQTSKAIGFPCFRARVRIEPERDDRLCAGSKFSDSEIEKFGFKNSPPIEINRLPPIRRSKPTEPPIYWRGKLLDQYTKEELVQIIVELGAMINGDTPDKPPMSKDDLRYVWAKIFNPTHERTTK